MHPLIAAKLPDIQRLCREYHVRRLELFGSATGDRFDPTTSDVDLLVEFEPRRPERGATPYFKLLQALEELFGRHVDFVSPKSIRNPYFKRSVEESRELIYTV